VDTSDQSFRENYSKLVNEEEKRLNHLFNKNRIDVINISTDKSYELPLKRFFKIRERRVIR